MAVGALVGSRLILTLIALAVGAKVAGSSAPIIMLLGINRLGQAAIVMRHALATGIPFAPEKDGTSFLSGQISGMASRPPGPVSQYPPQRWPSHQRADWPPASGQDSQHEADPARRPYRILPPAADADPAGHPGTGRANDSPHDGGAAADLATLARLAGEWLASTPPARTVARDQAARSQPGTAWRYRDLAAAGSQHAG